MLDIAKRAVEKWYAEKDFYSYKVAEFSIRNGHFTQLVWKKTRAYGAGIGLKRVKSAFVRYVYVYYNPHGNTAGKFKSNVQDPAKCVSKGG
jgi:hypothetical protein